MDGINWYSITDVNEIDTPFLAIYPERVKANIDALVELIPDVSRLRPHVKTNKSMDAIGLMWEAAITKFKCATIAEAEMLAIVKAPDVMLAYQPIGPKIDRLINLIKNYPTTIFSCLVDNEVTAKEIEVQASLQKIWINVYLDLNVGMNRTGIIPGQDAIELYKQLSKMQGIKLIGLHAYDGQITDTDIKVRQKQYIDGYKKVQALKDKIIDLGLTKPIINAGSTPTLRLYAQNQEAECSPGTFIYWDQSYKNLYAELPFITAALVVTRVISKPGLSTLCLDLGYKAVSSESELQQRVHFLNASNLKVISQSEEHMLIETAPGHNFEIGEIFYGVPYHIGRTCNLYQMGLTVNNHKINGKWHHSLGRKIIF